MVPKNDRLLSIVPSFFFLFFKLVLRTQQKHLVGISDSKTHYPFKLPGVVHADVGRQLAGDLEVVAVPGLAAAGLLDFVALVEVGAPHGGGGRGRLVGDVGEGVRGGKAAGKTEILVNVCRLGVVVSLRKIRSLLIYMGREKIKHSSTEYFIYFFTCESSM